MQKQGFTLIELLIVVAIIGILAAIAVPNFLQAQVRAKIAQMQGTLKTMVTTLETYRIDNGSPPIHFNEPQQNKWMTTPIAYASTRPYDVFQDFNAGAERQNWHDYGLKERFGCPHYETGRANMKPGEYWIVGMGPDMTWETFGSIGEVTWDISNGIRSRGDMYVFNSSLTHVFH